MIQAKCIQKFRDKQNKIYGYKLVDINGQTQDVKSDNLKQAIRNKQIQVVNLTLTSDGRLVDKVSDNLKSSKLGEAPVQKQSREDEIFETASNVREVSEIDAIFGPKIEDEQPTKINKTNTTNMNNLAVLTNKMIRDNYITYIPNGSNGLCTSHEEILYNKHIIFKSLVPSDIINKALLDNKGAVKISRDIIAYPKNKNTVIIASSKKIALQDSYAGTCDCGLFKELHIKSIDIRDVDMHLMTDMTEMFSNCDATHYNLDGLDLSMCDSYAYMFYRCNAHTISMHDVKINKQADTSYMFGEMTADELITYDSFIEQIYENRVW